MFPHEPGVVDFQFLLLFPTRNHIVNTKLLVVSGPLGSGKTSLLNALLPFVPGKKLLIVNDVGQVNVDAERLADAADIRPITSGCVGCKNLGELVRIATQAATADFNWLVLEPTGVADAREIREALTPLGFEWRCLTLVNVRDFALDLADGIVVAQLDAATAVALTHTEGVTDISDERLLSVIEQISLHAPQMPLSIIQEPSECALTERQTQQLLQEHGVRGETQKQTYQFRGVRAVSMTFTPQANVLALTSLLEVLGQQGYEITRGKGAICDETGKYREYDIVHGQLSVGSVTDRSPHGVFIAAATRPITAEVISSIGLVTQRVLPADKEQLLTNATDVDATCLSLRRWCNRFPEVRRADGNLRVRCEAGMVIYLALRENVPNDLRREAVTSYATWLLKAVDALPEAAEDGEPGEVASWKFMLGKVLMWLVVIQGVYLLEKVLRQILSVEPFRLTIEGLQELSSDVRDDSATWEDLVSWPEKKADVLLRHGLQHGLLQAKQTLLALRHGHQLVSDADAPQADAWHKLVQAYTE
jgi:G3E family GTPase